MQTKTVKFRRAIFKPEIIQEAFALLLKSTTDKTPKSTQCDTKKTEQGDTEWDYDSDEEFYADYRKGVTYAFINKNLQDSELSVSVFNGYEPRTMIKVAANSRARIEAIFFIFERELENSIVKEVVAVEEARKPVIFIEHGGNPQWTALKDHLHEQHGYEVQAYEIGARAGDAIRDIIEDMMTKSSFALLVMTGEDRTEHGALRPRMNVVHELGLFQGKLGFSRAVVLLEAETEDFSNISGIHQIRFSKGNIKETFGDVLATLRREFASR